MERLEAAQQKRDVRVFRLLGESIALWRRNFLSFSAIYLLVHVPIAALHVLSSPDPNIDKPPAQFYFYMLAIFILSTCCNIALISASRGAFSEGKVLPFKNLKRAWRCFPRFVGTLILENLIFFAILVVTTLGAVLLAGIVALFFAKLKGIFLMIGSVALVLAIGALAIGGVCFAVYFGVRLSLGIYACVLENKGPVASLKQSFCLVKQRVNAVIGVFFVLFISSGILHLPGYWWYYLGKESQQLNIVPSILQFAAGFIMIPMWSIAPVNLYQQLKDKTTDQ